MRTTDSVRPLGMLVDWDHMPELLASSTATAPVAPALSAAPAIPLAEPVSVVPASVVPDIVVPDIAARRRHRGWYDASLTVAAADVIAVTVTAILTSSSIAGAVLLVVAMLVSRSALRAYRPRLHLSALDDAPRTIGAALLGLGLLLGVRLVLLDGQGVAVRSVAQVSCAAGISLVITGVGFAFLRSYRRRHHDRLPTVLVVGASKVGRSIDESLRAHPELGMRPVGLLDSRHPQGVGPATTSARSDAADLVSAIEHSDADAVVLAFAGAAEDYTDALIAVHQTGSTLFVVPSLFELHHDGLDVDRVRGIPMIRLRSDPTKRLSWRIKRGMDVLAAGIGLVLAAPLLATFATAILVESGRPILFRQQRIGRDGEAFELLKLRSMRPETRLEGETTWNIADDPRLTALGRLIRRTSVDEIPQLWNVIRGQMSLVGPRPERPVFVEKFSAEHERYWARHRVPAGLTGLAQVNGLRGDTSIHERARYDNYYIANWSLWLDAKIVLLTAREVLGGHGG